jgi:diguanylate cyclase (GGDEF)-like protein
LRRLRDLFSVPHDQPALVQEQLRAFSRQIPLLYFILITNMAFLAATHLTATPLWLCLGPPLFMVIAASLRIMGWWKTRHREYTPEQARKRLKSTVVLAGVFGVFVTAWCLSLLPYGDAYQKMHIAFYMAITLVACVFCLMQLRAAGIVLTICVAIPFGLVFGSTGNMVMIFIAINVVLVAGAMLYMLNTHYNQFTTMVNQRDNLERINNETQRLSTENYKLANLDSLTLLPNRRSFIAMIHENVEARKDTDRSFSVGLIDLDGFKAVNDLYGHAIGDDLLVEVSRRLEHLRALGVTFARLGGDEFGFITRDAEELGILGLNICETLRQPYVIQDIKLEISASCGISSYPASCETPRELLECADYALYQAKAHRNGGTMIFTTSHREQLRISQQVDHALRQADLEAEMRMAYQPVVDARSGETIAMEALARWSNAILGHVAPTQFITTAERSPLINKLTRVLLNKMFEDMAQFPVTVPISFNLSAKSIASPDFMLQLVAAIQASKVAPKRLQFEVTETALMVDFDAALRALHLLRNLGCRIALDDFGTGYSSLSYVHQLPLDTIKIDRKFVMDLEHNAKARDIVRTIVGLSDALKLQCVAEGVETIEQVKILRDIGCHIMQGFLYSVPLPAVEVARVISAKKPEVEIVDEAQLIA